MMRSIFILLLVSIAYSSISFAYEVLDICATYSNTNKKYKVEAKVFTGIELNGKTNSFNYQPYSKYAVIFWAEGQASVIELDYAFGGINQFGSYGKDQQGHRWELSTTTTFCY